MDIGLVKSVVQDTTLVFAKDPRTKSHLRSLANYPAEGIPLQTVQEGRLAEDAYTVVDCALIDIAVHNMSAEFSRGRLVHLLEESSCKELLEEGPSYLHLAEILGDPIVALRLFGLGEALGLWYVVLPKDVDVGPKDRVAAALLGWVCISGYPRSVLEHLYGHATG